MIRSAMGTALGAGLLGLLATGVAAAAGDPDRGRDVAAVCAPCHGIDGVSPSPAFPILAGQHEIYLANTIRAYQSGQRSDAVMGGSVRTLTDQQIDDVSAYYASQKGLAPARPARAGPNQAALAAAESAGAEQSALDAGASGPAAATATAAAASAGAPVPVKRRPNTLAGCPVNNPNIPETQDLDRDGLPDRFDAAPADANEFVRDADGDGWFDICDIRQLQAIQTLGGGPGNATNLDWPTRVGRRYELVQDLDASVIANFQPIGNCGPKNNCMLTGDSFGFTGSLDGGGHVIRKLRISRPEAGGVGLFGVLARSGHVSGLVLEKAEVTGLHGVGALVGANFGLITDSRVNVKVSGRNATGAMVGGHAGKVIRCSASGQVTGNDAIGGLIGDMRGFVARSHASTGVSGHNGVGGLVGLNTFSTLVSSYATGRVQGNNNVGGLAGINTDAVVADSYATARVEGTGTNAGGLVAFNSQSRIRNSYARGRVSGVNSVGALVGTNNGSIRASYATGKVSGTSQLGGLVGDNAGGSVAASYWEIKGTGRVFGAGSDDKSGDVDDTDNNRVDAGEENSLSTYGKTLAALRVLNAASTGWLPGPRSDPATLDQYYCDANADGAVTPDEQRQDNLSWDFGTEAELPGIRCIDGGRGAQPLR